MARGSRTSSHDIQPVLSATNLIGSTRGRVCSRGNGRGQLPPGARPSLFSPVENHINQRDHPSRVSGLVPAVETQPSLSQALNEILSATSTNFGGRSQKEAFHGVLGRKNALIERAASLILERDQLATSLRNADQRLSELEDELHFETVEKCAGCKCRSESSSD